MSPAVICVATMEMCVTKGLAALLTAPTNAVEMIVAVELAPTTVKKPDKSAI